MTDSTLPTPSASVQYPHRPAKVAPPAVPDKSAAPSAKDRLAASRSQVRSALLSIEHPSPKPLGSSLGDRLADAIKDIPGMSIVLDTAKGWWQDHGAAAQTAGQASRAVLQPMAKRNPAGLVGLAVGAGVLLVLLKPWRWLLRPKFLFAVASLVATQAIKGRSASAWLQTALRLTGKAKRSP